MKEVAFLKLNAEKWKKLEGLLNNSEPVDADIYAGLFLEITDDLSFARTHFPGSKTTQYLNGLAGKLHQEIYRNKRTDKNRLVTFWKTELPTLYANHRNSLLYSFVIFSIAVMIGTVSTLNDTSFVRLILGDGYVNMTEHNIEKGDPLAVYKDARQLQMFFGITLNNIRVSFLCFSAGILLSVGTAFMLFTNGVMLGTFHTFFYLNSLLGESLLVIYIHGALEISAIIIAGSAGLVLGNSILFPGSFTRRESLQRGAKDGLKIAIGLVPVFIAAGFLESFVTRYTEMPVALSLLIIFGSLAFIGFYFIAYPAYLNQKAKK